MFCGHSCMSYVRSGVTHIFCSDDTLNGSLYSPWICAPEAAIALPRSSVCCCVQLSPPLSTRQVPPVCPLRNSNREKWTSVHLVAADMTHKAHADRSQLTASRLLNSNIYGNQSNPFDHLDRMVYEPRGRWNVGNPGMIGRRQHQTLTGRAQKLIPCNWITGNVCWTFGSFVILMCHWIPPPQKIFYLVNELY
jgi:hypothetical protein